MFEALKEPAKLNLTLHLLEEIKLNSKNIYDNEVILDVANVLATVLAAKMLVDPIDKKTFNMTIDELCSMIKRKVPTLVIGTVIKGLEQDGQSN